MRGVYFVASDGDLAILDRGRAGDTQGSDKLAIRDEGNAAFERRGSAPRQRARAQGRRELARGRGPFLAHPASRPDTGASFARTSA